MEAASRRLQLAVFPQGIAQIQVCVGLSRQQFDRPKASCQRILALKLERGSQTLPAETEVGITGNQFPRQAFDIGISASLEQSQ